MIPGDPATYSGQPLCPRCGIDPRGRTYPVCAEFHMVDGVYERWSHAETCERYEYSADLCDPCERLMQEELAHHG